MPDSKGVKVAAVNYTDAMVETMVETYTCETTDEGRKEAVLAIAEDMGRTTRSIIAKLSREKVYVKAARLDKTGSAVVRKDQLADQIGEALGLAEGDTDSLAKANKRALQAIMAALHTLKALSAIEAAES